MARQGGYADRTMNPLVNAGAMATTSLVPGMTADEKFENIVAAMSRFAGRRLVMDDDVYASEAGSNAGEWRSESGNR